jgi:hypothetical protein
MYSINHNREIEEDIKLILLMYIHVSSHSLSSYSYQIHISLYNTAVQFDDDDDPIEKKRSL